jgi:peptidoglycan LD-endopeptidase LytH
MIKKRQLWLLGMLFFVALGAVTLEAATAIGMRRYVFPVQATGNISYGAAHHDYPATDIFCPSGSLFRAVVDGVVDHVSVEDTWVQSVNDPESRGGLSVAMIGDDGIRYYGSHLSAIAEGIVVGSRVVAGQTLGYTGDTGNARVTPPHVHFGMSRPTTPEDWATRRGEVSPYPYLKLWQSADVVVPVLSERED